MVPYSTHGAKDTPSTLISGHRRKELKFSAKNCTKMRIGLRCVPLCTAAASRQGRIATGRIASLSRQSRNVLIPAK